MDALDIERSIAAGEQALQALITFARKQAGKLEARARRQREDTRDDAPRAKQVRRLASLVRTKQAVMELIRADAERRIPSTANRWSSCSMAPSACGAWRPSSSGSGGV